MWTRALRFGQGWEGTFETELGPVDFQSTWYGEKTRKGSVPPPRLAVTLERRVRQVIEVLPSLIDLTAKSLAGLHASQWRGRGKLVTPAELTRQLGAPRLELHGGESTQEYSLVFAPLAAFDRYRPQLTVTRGEPDFLTLDAPAGTSGPYVAAKMHLSVRAPRAQKQAHSRAKPRRAPTVQKVAWRPRWVAGEWKGEVRLQGKRVVAQVHTARDDRRSLARAQASLERLLAVVDGVLDDAAVRLAERYEQSWSSLARAPLEGQDVRRRVKLTALRLDGARFTLTLSDGGLFGRHVIEVRGHGARLGDVDLVG